MYAFEQLIVFLFFLFFFCVMFIKEVCYVYKNIPKSHLNTVSRSAEIGNSRSFPI